MAPELMETERLLLRVEHEDAAARVLDLYLRNRDEFEAYEPTRPEGFYTEDFHRQVLRREYNMYLSEQFLRYHLYFKEQPEYCVGSLNFNIRNDGNIFCEIGYKIEHTLWNQGVATEAVVAGIEIMQDYYPITRVDARILGTNKKSRHLVKKLGFVFMCEEPQSANILGKDVDITRYTLAL